MKKKKVLSEKDIEQKDIANVVKFFMQIYKLQLKVPTSTASHISIIPPQAKGLDYTYEFRVKREDRNETRRMSLALLGEGTGSKSKCFKVIYDHLLVIKIPPFPITNFDDYIESLRIERRTAGRLAPDIEFVAPGVSAIITRILTLPDEETLSPVELEKKYIQWLKKNPKYQKYLKIKGSFVFFMDLSKHSFLANVVENIHPKGYMKQAIHEEISKSYNLLWDILGFEGKYGTENLSVCFDMNRVFSDYEIAIRALLDQYRLRSAVSAYEKHKWLIDKLAGKKVEPDKKNYPSRLGIEVNKLIDDILENNIEDVESYRRVIRDYIHDTSFSRSKSIIRSIIVNMIELLAWLRKKQLAIRDLKPDNLFVVRKMGKDPLFGSTEGYSLGLIDFETAVVYKTDGLNPIEQPLRAGTPSYATPSHLFPNDLLIEMLDDLPRTLHMQDWYAAVGIIYNTITGEVLFEHTRNTLLKIKDIAKKSREKRQTPSQVFKMGSTLFWNSALNEFREKTSENSKILNSVELIIPEIAKELLKENVVSVKDTIETAIQKRVVSQVIFSSNKNRKHLIKCSLEELSKYKNKWEKGVNTPKTTDEVRSQIVRLLQDLEGMKLQLEQQNQIYDLLNQSYPRMTVYQLLDVMFTIILKAMHNEEWGPLSIETGKYTSGPVDGKPEETTMLYEATILFD